MKLQAITICVHGADLLSCALSNRHQFDRWLIVTVPRDIETIALCRDNGLECVATGILRPDGADLYERDNLARVTEEALARLDPDGWVVLLSEFVVLPRIFRAQILAAKLEADCEYRLAGVRHCPNRGVFERLATLEPWRAMPTAAADEDPPFRMFARSGSSAAARIGQLSITALTVGGGTQPFGVAAPSDSRRSLMTWLGARAQGKRTAMVAGYYPGLDLVQLATLFDTVYLQDLFGLHPESPALAACGHDGLRHVWAAAMQRLAPQVKACMHELGCGDDVRIPTGSIQVLYLPGEVLPDSVVRCLSVWRRVLHPDAIVCGDLHGMADWPEATSAIARLFGRPQVDPTGFWWTALAGTPLGAVAAPRPGNGSDTIALSAGDAPDEDVLLSLYSLRKAWPGPIHVDAPRPNPALELQCTMLGGQWGVRGGSAERERRLVVSAGTLAFGTIKHNQAVGETDAARFSPFALLQHIGLTRRRSSLVRYQGDPARWTKKARAARCRMTADLCHALQPSIRVAADSTVAAIIDSTTLVAFKAQWPLWSFDATPIIIACTGLDKAEMDWIMAVRNAHCIEIEPSAAASPARTLRRIVAQTKTKRLILLPAGARPLPGATLFAGQDHSSTPIVFHSSAEVQPIAGVAPLPERQERLAACMDLALARDICRAKVVKHKGSIGALLNRALQAGQARWSTCNLGREGWQLEARPPNSGAR